MPNVDRTFLMSTDTKLLNPGKSEEITGFYEFVCTFPGHSATMFGEFESLQSGRGSDSDIGLDSEAKPNQAVTIF